MYLAMLPTIETIDFLLDALLPLLSPANIIFDSDFLADFPGFSAKVCILTQNDLIYAQKCTEVDGPK